MVSFCPVLDYIATLSTRPEFVLVDIGCAGGIDRRWRRLGRRLRAIAFDANAAEIERLRKLERNPAIVYENAFVSIDPAAPFAIRKNGRPDCERNSWPRTSAKQYSELVHPRASASSSSDALKEIPVVIAPDYLQRHGIHGVDFLKIDVDGPDFDVLNSFDEALAGSQILGVGVEVNFCGSASETDHTFHNMDRFLKARGFELLTLSTRRYSVSALPSRFLGGAGPTETGRVLQGDAMYARDLASGLYPDFAGRLSPDKLLNLMAILAVFNLPDCAAELALKFRAALSARFDVDAILDLLNGARSRRREWQSELSATHAKICRGAGELPGKEKSGQPAEPRCEEGLFKSADKKTAREDGEDRQVGTRADSEVARDQKWPGS